MNAASGLRSVDSVSPGEFIAIYGSGACRCNYEFPAPLSFLHRGSYRGDRRYASRDLFCLSSGQIDCLVPYGVAGNSVAISVNNNGTVSNTVSVPLARTAPGIFSRSRYHNWHGRRSYRTSERHRGERSQSGDEGRNRNAVHDRAGRSNNAGSGWTLCNLRG